MDLNKFHLKAQNGDILKAQTRRVQQNGSFKDVSKIV